jgi:tetratricopeptide (TPR) repeat protein
LVLVERGALDEAETLFTTANAIAPHAIAFRGLGMVAKERARATRAADDLATTDVELQKAYAFLTRALAINPRYQQAALTLAGVLYDAGRYRAALAQYQRTVAIAPDTESGRQAAAAAEQLGAWVAAHPDAP